MGIKSKFFSRSGDTDKHHRMRLIIVLPFLMALFSVGSSIFILSISNPSFGLLRSSSHDVILWLVLILILSASAGLAIAHGITTPLQQLTNKLENIAAGNFMQPLDMAAEREIESLAQAFNSMMASINRYILEGMAGAAMTIDSSKRVVSFNPVAEIVFGYAQEEVLGKPLARVLPEQGENRSFYSLLESAIDDGRGCTGREIAVITREGERMIMKISLSLLKGDTGTRVGILATFKNLAEIQRLRDQLQRADQLMTIGTMTAGIAHEIRNPLGSISGLLQLLREDLSEDEHKLTYIDTIMRATDRINNLIEALLALANPALSRTAIRDVNEMLRETVVFAQFDHSAKGIDFVEQYDSERLRVQVDPEKLSQAFLNIVRNALQATPEGGRVTLTTARRAWELKQGITSKKMNRPADVVQIRCNNTGSYIPPENYKQVFTPFFSTKKDGSGLGLSITKQIIVAHGGNIQVESSEETGTTFCIELPFAAEKSAVQ